MNVDLPEPILTVALAGVTPHEPPLLLVLPFVALLAAIAILPLVPQLSHWWHRNRNKLIVSLALALPVVFYYAVSAGVNNLSMGLHAVTTMLGHAVVGDYIPFMTLLFSLYVISGGIRLSGDFPAHPATNCCFLFLGALMASFIGTTGASMLLIRPLLQTNRERRHVSHTIIFFIFLVSNIGGALLPVGDPPLFLGYLRGVPFLWTLNLFWPWAVSVAMLLLVYFFLDLIAYKKENLSDIIIDETRRVPLKLEGTYNFLLLAGVVLAVAFLVPGRSLPLCSVTVPDYYLREILMLLLAGISWALTPRRIHKENHFNFHSIAEVACLFIGIFITMQIPIDILKVAGAQLGVSTPMEFFWFTGGLSSILDNAPTYAVFFELAGAPRTTTGDLLAGVATATGHIPVRDLLAISCGAVFMGAMTYIGNGPNFLVKSIAEHRGIKMPGFFGYMVWSGVFLVPLFVMISLLFFY